MLINDATHFHLFIGVLDIDRCTRQNSSDAELCLSLAHNWRIRLTIMGIEHGI
jgi:hypothetical protein